MPRKKTGSMREVRPGVWEVRVSVGYRRDGSQRTAQVTVHGSERDADAARISLAAEMGRCPTLGDPMTLDEYFYGHFLPGRQASTTRANSKTYESVWRNHISPAMGDRDVASVTNVDVQAWVNGLPPQSAPAYVRALRAVFSQARFDHVISDSPMEGYRFRMPRGRRTAPLPVWSAQDVLMALDTEGFAGSQLWPLWLVMVGAGLSRSEALAIDWEDIEWTDVTGMDGKPHWVAVLTIEAACTALDGMKDPKNDRRYRRVPMAPLFADRLRESMGAGPICQSIHNGRPTGRRLSPEYVPKRWRQLFDEGAPLERLPFVPINRMRATYATLSIGAGLDSALVNAAQGRAPGSEVLYQHYFSPDVSTLSDAAMRMQRGIAGEYMGLYGSGT